MLRFIALATILLVAFTSEASAGLQFGDIVFSQDGAGGGALNAVLKADPTTGNQTILSQPGVIGSGPDFGSIIGGLAIDSNGQILLAAYTLGAVFKIDPNTGNRTILSGAGVGTGTSLGGINDLIIGADGQIYVSAQGAQAIVRIDPLTGNRTEISGPSVGTGPGFGAPFGIAQSSTGDFYIYDANLENAYFVDGVTGDRTIVSGSGVGGGVPFGNFGLDIVQTPGGDLATTDPSFVYRVDSSTGNRSYLSGMGVGTGPALEHINFMSLAFDGSLIASGGSAIYRIDPITGNRSILAGEGIGVFYDIGVYREAVIAAVPEVSSLGMMGAAAVVSLLAYRKRCKDREANL
jgi:hypothetical protein